MLNDIAAATNNAMQGPSVVDLLQKQVGQVRLEMQMVNQELALADDLMGFGADPAKMQTKLAMLQRQEKIILDSIENEKKERLAADDAIVSSAKVSSAAIVATSRMPQRKRSRPGRRQKTTRRK